MRYVTAMLKYAYSTEAYVIKKGIVTIGANWLMFPARTRPSVTKEKKNIAKAGTLFAPFCFWRSICRRET